MAKTLVWQHAIPWMNEAQDELLDQLGLAGEVVKLVSPGVASSATAMPWYIACVPSRDWAKEYMSLPLGVAESELHHRSIGHPGPQVPHKLTASSQMEYFVQQIAARGIEHCLVWNGWQLVPRALVTALRHLNKRYLFVERGFLPGSLCVDPRGLMVESSLTAMYWQRLVNTAMPPAHLAQVQQALHEAQKCDTEMWASRDADNAATCKLIDSLDRSKPTVLLVGQLDWDSNVLQRTPLFPTNKSMVNAFEHLSYSMNVIYKPHPKDPAPVMAPASFISAAGLKTTLLVRNVDAVVTRTSTVGIEATVWKRPLIVLGDAIYGQRGFTADVRRLSELESIVRRVVNSARDNRYWTAESSRQRLIFMRWLLFEHLFFRGVDQLIPGMSNEMIQSLKGCLTA